MWQAHPDPTQATPGALPAEASVIGARRAGEADARPGRLARPVAIRGGGA